MCQQLIITRWVNYNCGLIVIRCVIYNPPNNFFGLSLGKNEYVIQNGTMVIRRYPPSDLISVPDFISTE